MSLQGLSALSLNWQLLHENEALHVDIGSRTGMRVWRPLKGTGGQSSIIILQVILCTNIICRPRAQAPRRPGLPPRHVHVPRTARCQAQLPDEPSARFAPQNEGRNARDGVGYERRDLSNTLADECAQPLSHSNGDYTPPRRPRSFCPLAVST